jgi:hypothetical protein
MTSNLPVPPAILPEFPDFSASKLQQCLSSRTDHEIKMHSVTL